LYLDSLRCFLSSKPFVDSLLIHNDNDEKLEGSSSLLLQLGISSIESSV
jgi:hypothetical protein